MFPRETNPASANQQHTVNRTVTVIYTGILDILIEKINNANKHSASTRPRLGRAQGGGVMKTGKQTQTSKCRKAYGQMIRWCFTYTFVCVCVNVCE